MSFHIYILEVRRHFPRTNYKEALKSALYEPLLSRDWYREVTFEEGMHADLIFKFIRILALTVAPITPHFSEHIWKSTLKEEGSIQTTLWPDAPVDYQPQPGFNHAAAYMRGTLKSMRDAELAIAKRKAKKGGPTEGVYDPHKPKGLNIFVASSFPPWQDQSVAIAQGAYDATTGTIDDAKVKDELSQLGLLKDKRVMPFIQMLKVRAFRSNSPTPPPNHSSALETDGADRCRSDLPTTAVLPGD